MSNGSEYGSIPYEVDEITSFLQNYLNDNLSTIVADALGDAYDQIYKLWYLVKSSDLDDLLKSDDDVESTNSTDYIKVKEVTFNPIPYISFSNNPSPTIHIKWEQKSDGMYANYSKIYVNDSPISSEKFWTGDEWHNFTYDLETLSYNDKIQIYMKSGLPGYNVYCRNFRFYGIFEPIKYTIPIWS